jgi:hypothetical protein
MEPTVWSMSAWGTSMPLAQAPVARQESTEKVTGRTNPNLSMTPSTVRSANSRRRPTHALYVLPWEAKHSFEEILAGLGLDAGQNNCSSLMEKHVPTA